MVDLNPVILKNTLNLKVLNTTVKIHFFRIDERNLDLTIYFKEHRQVQSKRMKNKYDINNNHKKAGLDILPKEKVEFKTGQSTRDKNDIFIMLKG